MNKIFTNGIRISGVKFSIAPVKAKTFWNLRNGNYQIWEKAKVMADLNDWYISLFNTKLLTLDVQCDALHIDNLRKFRGPCSEDLFIDLGDYGCERTEDTPENRPYFTDPNDGKKYLVGIDNEYFHTIPVYKMKYRGSGSSMVIKVPAVICEDHGLENKINPWRTTTIMLSGMVVDTDLKGVDPTDFFELVTH